MCVLKVTWGHWHTRLPRVCGHSLPSNHFCWKVEEVPLSDASSILRRWVFSLEGLGGKKQANKLKKPLNCTAWDSLHFIHTALFQTKCAWGIMLSITHTLVWIASFISFFLNIWNLPCLEIGRWEGRSSESSWEELPIVLGNLRGLFTVRWPSVGKPWGTHCTLEWAPTLLPHQASRGRGGSSFQKLGREHHVEKAIGGSCCLQQRDEFSNDSAGRKLGE